MPLVVNAPELVESLYTSNVRLAYFLSNKYAHVFTRWDVEEFESLALYGLFRAARAYVPEKGPFSKYATRAIKNLLYEALQKSPVAIEEYFETPKTHIGRFLDEKDLDVSDELARIESLVKKLSLPRNAWQVIELRYIKGLTLAEVGKVFGVTRQRVEQIEKMTLKEIREQFAGSN